MNIQNKDEFNYISNNSIEEFKIGYKFSYPFPFTFIDNFIKNEKINNILDELENLKSINADTKFINPYDLCSFNKYAFTSNLGPNISNIFDELVSDNFINYIEKCTGITNIIRNDKTLYGGGVHRIHKDGYLGIHTDFNIFYNEKYGLIDRRINLLIYLNPDWKEEYKGELLLCSYDKPKVCYRILPIQNRCVMFNTTGISLHGHPEILNCPENKYRQSIAVYYYTKNKNNDPSINLQNCIQNKDITDFEGNPYRETVFYDINQFK